MKEYRIVSISRKGESWRVRMADENDGFSDIKSDDFNTAVDYVTKIHKRVNGLRKEVNILLDRLKGEQ